jgi:hypothetical protein
MDNINSLDSSFFNNNSGFVINKPEQITEPITVKSQEMTKNFIFGNKTNELNSSNIVVNNQSQDTNSLFDLDKNESLNYTRKSILDLDNKKNQINYLNERGSNISRATTPESNSSFNTNNQISNNISNVTNIVGDYVRNIRMDYSKIPNWKSEMG